MIFMATIPLCAGFSCTTTCNSYLSRQFFFSSQLHLPSQLQLKGLNTPKLRFIFSSSSSTEFDLSPPPIDHDLLDTMEDLGAKISEAGVAETFGNDDEAIEAAYNGVAVVDLSHFGRIRVTGDDRNQFLHNQSTANFEDLSEGQGCDTVFVTPTARTIDIAYAWVMKSAITLVVSPITCRSITEMLMKYIFFADKVEIHDITKQTSFFVLLGANSSKVLEDLNLGDLVGQPHGTHKHYSVNKTPITVGVGSVIGEDGFSLMLSPAAADSVWKTLLNCGAVPMGADAWERFRVLQGRPAPNKELTNDFNVLEAGLWNSVSVNKGCYKGQETIARLVTYDGVKQKLYGIHLSSPVEPGSSITLEDGKKVGQLTSYAIGRKGGHFGLGYIKRKTASVGDKVLIGDIVGTLVEVPYLAKQTPITKVS